MKWKWNTTEALGLTLTFKCPAACKCCGFEAGPERTEVMKFSDAINFIDQASKIESIKFIAFNGGEPFLYLTNLKKLISYANERRLESIVVTNCFWASDFDYSLRLLKDLKNIGLTRLAISVDDFHMEYIPFGFIKNAVDAAVLLDLDLELQILRSKNNCITKENLIAMLGINDLDKTKIKVFEASVIPVGRAARYFSKDDLVYTDDQEMFDLPCPHIIKNPTILPNGDVSACCGFGPVSEMGRYSDLFIIGNAKKTKLDQILEEMYNDLLFNIIAIDGPYELIRLLKKEFPQMRFRDKYINICDVCLELFSRKDIENLLNNILPLKKSEIYIKKMYLNAQELARVKSP